jgi:hypothetical protein
MIAPVMRAFARAVWSQFHYRMLLLTLLPFLLSLLLWALLLWQGLQPMIDAIQAYFIAHDSFRIIGDALGSIGLGALKAVIVPLLAMWLLLPLVIVTALLFTGLLAMPAIVKHVSRRTYPTLAMRQGGSAWASLWNALSGLVGFLVMWLLSLPLALIPMVGLLIQPLLWGWLTCRVMAFDALALHADAAERKEILHAQRWPLLAMGIVTGAMGAAPTLLWLGGAFAVLLFPLLASVAIWLYVLIFIFTGLWFQHYCLDALVRHRAAVAGPAVVTEIKDMN